MAAVIASLGGVNLVAGYGNVADPNGVPQVAVGGNSSALNVTAAAVIKAGPGRICKVSVIVAGTTGGAFTINDCATVAGATTANEIFTMAYNAAANLVGAVFDLEFPCINGIVVSAVPTGGAPQLAISFN